VVNALGQLSVTDPLPASSARVRSPSDKSLDFHYQFPVNPGHQGLLAGTMGELRSTHFHAGIDIRTNNMVGVPIRSAQQGYVSRAWVSTFGYGRALFVKHPNGHTTVYAHLDRFKGALGDSVRAYQYKKQAFETDLFFQPDQFPVNEGDTIAFSGNTGGSSGPHLHFEIRDSNNEALNPLIFGFDEIKDTSSPIAQKIALKTLDINSRINDRFGRFEFYLYRVGNSYTFSKPILAHGRIGVEILAFDKMDLSGFRCGINQIEMMVDSQKVFSQVIDKINFNESRGILTLMDYKTMKTSGARFNKLYVDDAARLDYHVTKNSGEILVDKKILPVNITLRDTYGNTSKINFSMKPADVGEEAVWLDPMALPQGFSIQENTLAIAVKPCPGVALSPVTLYSKREKLEILPAYHHINQKVYLVDVRKMMPDSIVTCQGALRFDNQDVIPSGTDYKYFSDWADIQFRDGALYDTAYLILSKTEKDNQEIFSIGDGTVPLSTSIDIVLKPKKQYEAVQNTSVYRVNGGFSYQGGEWRNGRIRFQTQELGDFVILQDTLAPVIRRLVLTSHSARFRIRDNLSGIGYFEATLDGVWLLMNYDYKTGILQSEALDKGKPLRGNFQLKVVDHAGNERFFNQKIL
jgi:hypothetical protein